MVFDQILDFFIARINESKINEEEKKEKIADATIFRKRFRETEGFTPSEIWTIARIYQHLAYEDKLGPIYIKRNYQYFKDVLEVASPDISQQLWEFYRDFEVLPEKVKQKRLSRIDSFLEQFRTVENAYGYCPRFKEIADAMLKKVTIKEKMSKIDIIKWIRIWIVIFKNQNYFSEEVDKDEPRSPEISKKTDGYHLYPEGLMCYSGYMSTLEDGDLVLELLQKMLQLYPKDVQKIVERFGELDKNEPDSLSVRTIRNTVKKAVFPVPWIRNLAHFVTISGIKEMNPEVIINAVEACKDGGIKKMPKNTASFINTYDGKYTNQNVVCYQIMKHSVRENVSCQEELEMYVILYEWLLKHPEIKLGAEKKAMKDYVVPSSVEELGKYWAQSMNYINSPEEYNSSIMNKIIGEEYKQLLLRYYNGEVEGEIVARELGFSSDEQVIISCDKNASVYPNLFATMEDALKKVKRFKETKYMIWYYVFDYMRDYRSDVLPKKLKINYGKMKL